MLSALSISHYAIVDALELEFGPGLTVVTGETGAGKSIMIDALALALGDRADAGAVRPGADRADITATFDLARLPAALAWLGERELDAGSDCILRRTVGSDGRSRAFINGKPSTLADLKALGELLIDIHGQHEHQSLLRRDTHRQSLDEYGGLAAQAKTVAAAFREFRDKRDELSALEQAVNDRDARRDLLKFQVEELDRLGLKAGEPEALEIEHKRLANTDSLRAACEQAFALVYEHEDGAARDRLERARYALEGMEDAELARASELLASAIIHVEEAADALRHYTDRLEADPQRLQEIDNRLSSCFQLARKHRCTPGELPALHEKLKAELDKLDNRDTHRAALEKDVAAKRSAFLDAARKLGDARRKAAKKLEKDVSAQLAALGMAGGRFEVAFTALGDHEANAGGVDAIEFLVSLNPGQPPKPLAKVASGGELSRISLAIQVICAEKSTIPTLIFDEVDVGIGGATAEVVGKLLRRLGDRGQVLCVTHLAQVAACGHQHLRVEKRSDGKQTASAVIALKQKERVQEIARMAGGLTITPEALKHAEAMLAAH
ncbi:MAG: DNA repair protein RecN [Gammaproteobacteria bacterium]